MANRRRKAAPRRGRKTRGYFSVRKNLTYGQVGRKVINDVARLKSLINTEFKSFDQEATVSQSTTPSVILLNGAVKGDTLSTRDGRVVRLKSLQYSFFFTMNTSATSSHVRLIFFIDKQPSGVAPIVAQLLDTQSVVSFRNLDNRKRFVILKDFVVTLSNVGATKNAYRDHYRDLDMRTIYNDANLGTIFDIESNALYLIMFSNEATNTPTVERATRVRFIDN